MRPFTRVTGVAAVLDRADVDTDQIIPASWLKRIERTGFGEGLFSAWRADPCLFLAARLRQNTVQEKLANMWLDHLLEGQSLTHV